MARPEADAAKPGTAVYGEVLKEELAAQDTHKTSIEQRALAIITTSGTLATLLFAVATFATGEKSHKLASDAKTSLIVALGFFIAAAVLGLATNRPLHYSAMQVNELEELLTRKPILDENGARLEIALKRGHMLRNHREQNGSKGRLLTWAMVCEVVAIVALAISVGLVLSP